MARARRSQSRSIAGSPVPVPSYLETPPQSIVPPPVTTRAQSLPFDKLRPDDFERLCLRLVRKEGGVSHCRLYGEPGQAQEGIDFYAQQTLSSKLHAYQCKRVQQLV